MQSLFRRAMLASAFGFLGCSPTAAAHEPPITGAAVRPSPPQPPSPPATCSLSVEDEYGQRLPTYWHSGKTWVLGNLGQRYVVRVHNYGSGRVEAVVSVDGRDVNSGDVADYKRHRGYLVQPGDSVSIDGFRQSLEQVAAFRFVNPEGSYSSRRGTPQNTGIVGLACFAEKPRPIVHRELPVPYSPDDYHYRYEEGAAPSPQRPGKSAGAPPSEAPRASAEESAPSRAPATSGMPAPPSTDRLGTEYGESHYSPVREVQFERWHPTRPSQLITLRYDDAAGLQARGIQVYPEWRYSEPVHDPQAFPTRFAPPPP